MSLAQPYDNDSASRYELHHNGEIAYADYTLEGNVITFTHTIVPKALGGMGVGTALVTFALNDARARGLRVVPQCPFFAAYMKKHPEFDDLRVSDAASGQRG